MATFMSQLFGILDLEYLSQYYELIGTTGGHFMKVDLNFEYRSIDPKKMEPVNDITEKMEAFIDRATAHLLQAAIDGDEEVLYYISEHLEQLDLEEIGEIFETYDLDEIDPLTFIQKMELKRVGLYPETPEQFAVFDFTLPGEITDQLLVVKFNDHREVVELVMES